MAVRKAINSFIEFFYFPIFRFMPLNTFKYAVCGGTTVVVDFLVYYFFLYFVFDAELINFFGLFEISKEIAAHIIAFMVSFPLGFSLNKWVVFKESELRGRVQLFRYGLTVSSCFGISYLFMKLFIFGLAWDPVLSKVLTTVLVTVYSYFMQLYFSFQVKGSHAKKSGIQNKNV